MLGVGCDLCGRFIRVRGIILYFGTCGCSELVVNGGTCRSCLDYGSGIRGLGAGGPGLREALRTGNFVIASRGSRRGGCLSSMRRHGFSGSVCRVVIGPAVSYGLGY